MRTLPSRDMAEALQPLAARMRRKSSVVQLISQVELRLEGRNGKAAYDSALPAILNWMADRCGRPFPAEAYEGKSFAIDEVGAQYTEAVAIDEPLYWAARIDDADGTIPQRLWPIEVGLAPQADGSALFGCRLQCVSRGELAPVGRSVPRFVKEIVNCCQARLDGSPIEISPWRIATSDDVSTLVRLLRNPVRQHDVVVLSLPEGVDDWRQTIIPAERFARNLAGAAHIAVIASEASFALSELVGKEFSVFRQAVRTYRPKFDPDADEPFGHPLGLPHRIAAWDGGAVAYERFLTSQVLADTVSGRDTKARLPAFSEVKRVAGELRRHSARVSGVSQDELLMLAEQEIVQLGQTLRETTDEFGSLIDLADAERKAALDDLAQAKQTIFFLQQRVASLEEKQRSSGSAPEAIPESLDGFEEWCRANLSGSVELHNRAFQGIKKSQYEDVSLIYQALLLLRDFYVPMRREGGLAAKKAFERRCRQLGLEDQPSFAGAGWGEQGDTYVVKYGDKRVLLDRHLKKGNDREERYCFRLYFAWDGENRHVIVGWLPSHLTTRAT